MATAKYTRRDSVRDLQHVAVEARKIGDRDLWRRACSQWQAIATAHEQSMAPRAITAPWPQREGK